MRPMYRHLACLVACSWTSYCAAEVVVFSIQESLSFGSFVANTGGTITLPATANPARIASGGVILLPQPAPTSARCSVHVDTGASPDPNYPVSYHVTLPADGTVELATAGGARMAVNQFSATTSPTGTIPSATTPGTVHVGATLGVGANQAPGNYTGTFQLTVDWP